MNKNKVYIKDILDAISDIEVFIANIGETEFYKNKEKKYAVVRALEIIGEAAKKYKQRIKSTAQRNPLERNCRNERQINPLLFWHKMGACLGNSYK